MARGVLKFTTTRIYRIWRRWVVDGSIDAIFTARWFNLHQDNRLDISVVHGDGTTTAAKKGGDNSASTATRKVKGDKVVAFCDRHCNVIAPFVSAPGNPQRITSVARGSAATDSHRQCGCMDLQVTVVSLDGVYDCRLNRKAIFNPA